MFKYNRKRIKEITKSQIPFVYQKRYLILAVAISLILIYFLSSFIKMALVMSAFIVMGVASLAYNRFIKVSLGFEFIMLGTLITSMVYGFLPGLIVAWVSLFFAEILTDRLTYSTSVSFVGLFIVSLAVQIIDLKNVTITGILMTLLYDFIIAPGYVIMGSNFWKTLLFVITHALFNTWIFIFIAPPVFSIVSSIK